MIDKRSENLDQHMVAAKAEGRRRRLYSQAAPLHSWDDDPNRRCRRRAVPAVSVPL